MRKAKQAMVKINFWSLLIEKTAQKLHNDRLARGQPGPVSSIQSVHEFEGKHLSLVMEYLKDRHRDIKEICDAAESDTFFGLIKKKASKVQDEYEHTNEDIAKEAEDIGW